MHISFFEQCVLVLRDLPLGCSWWMIKHEKVPSGVPFQWLKCGGDPSLHYKCIKTSPPIKHPDSVTFPISLSCIAFNESKHI